jgi:hypothetical protein
MPKHIDLRLYNLFDLLSEIYPANPLPLILNPRAEQLREAQAKTSLKE